MNTNTTTESNITNNNPVIGYYVTYAREMPPYVADRSIWHRPIVATKPETDVLSYGNIIEYLVWDDAGQANSVWMENESFARFAAAYKANPLSDFSLEFRHIDSSTVQVFLRRTHEGQASAGSGSPGNI
jgi:hypothetical protein